MLTLSTYRFRQVFACLSPWVSSANKKVSRSEEKDRSSMYTRNRMGQGCYSTLDYGHVNIFLFGFAAIYIDYLPPAQQVTFKPFQWVVGDNLIFFFFFKRILWLQTSKAFLRSRKIPMQKLPSFKALLIKFTTFNRLCSVFLFLWKPNCLGKSSLWYSRWLTSFKDTIFSSIFENELRRAIGL